MNILTKRKKKEAKKKEKMTNSKDKILGVNNPLRSKYFVFAEENISAIFCKLFSGRDTMNNEQ